MVENSTNFHHWKSAEKKKIIQIWFCTSVVRFVYLLIRIINPVDYLTPSQLSVVNTFDILPLWLLLILLLFLIIEDFKFKSKESFKLKVNDYEAFSSNWQKSQLILKFFHKIMPRGENILAKHLWKKRWIYFWPRLSTLSFHSDAMFRLAAERRNFHHEFH